MQSNQALVDRALRISIWEGGAWAFMVGLGETYFIADAVRLGASALELALLVTLPLALAGIGPLLTLWILRASSRKAVAGTAALLQMLTLAGLAFSEWTSTLVPQLLVTFACLYQIAGQATGTAWSSWFGDLVPEAERGRYFAQRNRTIYLAMCLGLIAGGLFLQTLEPGSAMAGSSMHGGLGFAVVFSIAALCRAISATLLIRTPEPEFHGVADRRETLHFIGSGQGRRAGKLLAVATAFHFTAYLSSPYFAAFMLDTLSFTYAEYMVASVWVVVIKALSTLWWGRAVDRVGARRIFRLALFLVAIVPLPWIIANDLWLVLVGQGLSGIAWCAYELGFFTSMLESTTPLTRPSVFAAQSLLVGWSQLGAGVVAAWLLGAVDGGYRTLFAVSAGGRLLIALLVPLWVRRDSVLYPVRAAALPFRTLGLRASGGLTRRPIFDPSGEPVAAPAKEPGPRTDAAAR